LTSLEGCVDKPCLLSPRTICSTHPPSSSSSSRSLVNKPPPPHPTPATPLAPSFPPPPPPQAQGREHAKHRVASMPRIWMRVSGGRGESLTSSEPGARAVLVLGYTADAYCRGMIQFSWPKRNRPIHEPYTHSRRSRRRAITSLIFLVVSAANSASCFACGACLLALNPGVQYTPSLRPPFSAARLPNKAHPQSKIFLQIRCQIV
jgi:hypothetical protein